MRKLNRIMVTGGAGFIGSNFIQFLFERQDFEGSIINIDNLTYAGNLENLVEVEKKWSGTRYFFEKADICDYDQGRKLLENYEIDTIVHFAAESHVDRSIFGPKEFINTNILGTFSLLEAARDYWKDRTDVLFHHISTDEVFGSLGDSGYFKEETPYDPKSPYSATKASSDHLVRSYNHTYGLPVTISNCSNNYGPYQFPEKLVPVIILNTFENKPLPVYGDGKNVRDWLFVEDHVSAVWEIIKGSKPGETYNVGGRNEWKNIDLVNLICERVSAMKGKDPEYYKNLITFIKDRPGHDRRYAIDCTKIEEELNWRPRTTFEKGLDVTIQWYMNNMDWVSRVRSGDYKLWIQKNYEDRGN